MKENEELKEAGEKLDGLSEDDRMQRIADLRLKAIMDEKAIYRKGIIDGKEEGREEGRQEGLAEGKRETKIEMVKNLYKMEMPIEQIAQATNIKIEEVKKILEIED